jgi:hypothetical protein
LPAHRVRLFTHARAAPLPCTHVHVHVHVHAHGVTQVGAKMIEEPYKLLIVDSIMALFRCGAHMRGGCATSRLKGQLCVSTRPLVALACTRTLARTHARTHQQHVAGLTSRGAASSRTASSGLGRCWRS